MPRRKIRLFELREILDAGFVWPASVRERAVTIQGKVDLYATLARLEADRDWIERRVNDAISFKQQSGLDYEEFTDTFDDDTAKLYASRAAIAHVRDCIEALDPTSAAPAPPPPPQGLVRETVRRHVDEGATASPAALDRAEKQGDRELARLLRSRGEKL